jgi:hypothetical protein
LLGRSGLRWFDTSQVHVLELHDLYLGDIDAAAMSQALRGSPQLRGLQLISSLALHPEVLQAVAACSQLTSLRLEVTRLMCYGLAAPAAEGLAALAQGCSGLRRLTLQGKRRLSADMLPALMRLPGLRLLRLLGCSKLRPWARSSARRWWGGCGCRSCR